jgi:hypothetical protein
MAKTHYANVKPLPSDPVKGGNILYLQELRVMGSENAPIRSEADLRDIIAACEVRHIMFHDRRYPSRAVPIEKAEKWIKKVGRELAKASSARPRS